MVLVVGAFSPFVASRGVAWHGAWRSFWRLVRWDGPGERERVASLDGRNGGCSRARATGVALASCECLDGTSAYVGSWPFRAFRWAPFVPALIRAVGMRATHRRRLVHGVWWNAYVSRLVLRCFRFHFMCSHRCKWKRAPMWTRVAIRAARLGLPRSKFGIGHAVDARRL